MSERLFFAVFPDAQAHAGIQRLVDHMDLQGRPVPPQNWHITLAFLGSVSADQRLDYERAAAQVWDAPFHLILDRLGYFPDARAMWLESREAPGRLFKLHRHLQKSLVKAGYQRDRRHFRAHLTLARNTGHPGVFDLPEPIPWRVAHFHLVRSELKPDGPIYYKEREYLLTGERPLHA